MATRFKFNGAMLLALCLSVSSCLCLGVSSHALAQVPTEGVRVREMPPQSPHWAFLVSPIFGSFAVSAVIIVDGDSLKILGMLTGGLTSEAVLSANHRQMYMVDTFFSRGSRGKRTDVLTIYDMKSLAPVGEVILPAKRQLTAPDNFQLGVTPDGRFLLAANITPAASVTVVDLLLRKVVGEIETSGCVEIQMAGNRRFTSMCGDGSILTVNFDDHGKTTSVKHSAPFFDPEKDLVFASPAVIGKMDYFVSYHGMVYPVDRSSYPVTAGKPWPLLTEKEKAQNWKPGGFQPVWAHARRGLLYVLMHQGGEWSHKQPGNEIWVFNAAEHKRVDRIVLRDPAEAIYVTQDDHPLIFTTSLGNPFEAGGAASSLDVLSALQGRYLGAIGQLGGIPSTIFGF
jgi:methylamine dehydrogenase heavy chain